MPAKAKQSAGMAQIGRGDPRVVAHPSFREIPKCLFPLKTEEAQGEYDSLARTLYDAGLLTIDRHRNLSSYAAQFDNVQKRIAAGDTLSTSAFTQMDAARGKLGLDDLDGPIAAPKGASTNKFARSGFANRRR